MRLIAWVLLAVPAIAECQTSFLSPCDIPDVKGARCGIYQVWENREAKSGPRIGLHVVVLPATGSRESDAVTFLAGGPGDAATRQVAYLAGLFAEIRKHRDILLVDQRGTGKSHPLECDLYPGNDPQTALGSFLPVDRVRACRATFAKTSNLQMYTSAPSVDDLDEVRAALGYDRLDLFGGSYGSRAALIYMRRHPEHVRVAVLQGISPPSDLVPLRFPRYAQNAIENVFADCRADPKCSKAFPDPAHDLQSIIARTAAKPVDAAILDSHTGDPLHVSLSRALLGEALRYLLYQSGTALYVPTLVHQAASGDFAPLAEFALASRRELVNGVGWGLYLSTTCSEDFPFINPQDAERQAAGTYLGDYRYRDLRAACETWTRTPMPADFHQPVRASTPVLLISGSWDPVTPPSNAQDAASTLPNSLSIVLPGGAHSDDGLPEVDACIATIANQVISRGSTTGIDTSCVSRLHHAPFPTAPVETKPVALTPAQKSALAGHYTSEGAPSLDVLMVKGKLIGRLEGEPEQLALSAVSPTRLRPLGLFGVYLEFQKKDGGLQVSFVRNGIPETTWTRRQ